MIKAIILDVDGVIVGDQPGVNFPLPHQEIIQTFKDLHKSGLPIVLCTAKLASAVYGIIEKAELDNLHIADGGALIVDPINHIIKKHVINKEVIKTCVELCLKNNIYVELYTSEAYYMQNSQVSELTSRRIKILQKEPIYVDSLMEIAEKEDIIKMITFADDDNDMPRIDKIVRQFEDRIHFIWSQHPYLTPVRPGIITAPNVSKAEAAKEVAESLHISFDEILGIGDAVSDWNFMSLCKYTATLENGVDKLKELVKTKGEGNYFISPHVNDNGILEIFRYFSILPK